MRDWFEKPDYERSVYLGHFRRYPHGDPFTQFILAQIAVILLNGLGIKKQSPNSIPNKPDPLDYTILDIAPHFQGSVFDVQTPVLTEEEEILQQANMILGLMNDKRMKNNAD